MNYLILISFIIYILYNMASAIKSKDQMTCLSDTYYIWPSWVFPLIMIIVSGTLLPAWLELLEGSNFQFLAFLVCGSIIFVGVASDYKNDKLEYKIHSICAYIACFLSIIALSFVMDSWTTILIMLFISFICGFIVGGSSFIKKRWIYIIEFALFLSVYITLLIKI